MKTIFPHVTIDPKIQGGKPVVAGTRVPIAVIIGHVAAGMTIPEIMKEYDLKESQVRATLRYASRVIAGERILAHT